jgi:hypothetical protein
MDESEKEEIIYCIIDTIAMAFSKEIEVDFLSDCSIKSLNYNIENLFKDIESFDDWINSKEEITNVILNHEL